MTKKKRIAFITINRFNPDLCDGVSNSSLELLLFLQKQGHEPAVLSFFTDEPYRQLAFHRLAAPSFEGHRYSAVLEGIPVHQELLPIGQASLADHSRLFLKAVTGSIREHDIESAFTVEDDFLSLFAISALAVPGVHFFHSVSYIHPYRQVPLFFKLLGKRPVFAVSRFLQRNVEQSLGLKAEVWYPLFDLERYHVARVDAPAASVGYYSSGPHKGDGIVNRLARLRPDWKFRVVGRNYAHPTDEKPGNLRAEGDVTDFRGFYGRTRLLIVPSLTDEGFPRVILEAAVNGIPAVANRVGGIPEAMGASGILVDFAPGHISETDLGRLANDYAREMEKLFHDSGLYEEFSRKARLRADEYITDQKALSRRNYEKYLNI